MNEQITTAAELDALPVGWAGIGVDGNIWQRVDARVEWQSLTGGGYAYASDFIRECAPLATLHRPDQPQRVQPSREDVEGALIGARSCVTREVVVPTAAEAVLALFAQQPTVAELCDEVERLRELAAAQNGRAGTAEAERDSALERLAAIHGWANQIAEHFGNEWPHTPACQGEAGCPLCMISEATSDPGEWLEAHDAEVKAEALREAAREFRDRLPGGTGNGRAYNSWRVAQMLDERADRLAPQPHEADRIEREARP